MLQILLVGTVILTSTQAEKTTESPCGKAETQCYSDCNEGDDDFQGCVDDCIGKWYKCLGDEGMTSARSRGAYGQGSGGGVSYRVGKDTTLTPERESARSRGAYGQGSGGGVSYRVGKDTTLTPERESARARGQYDFPFPGSSAKSARFPVPASYSQQSAMPTSLYLLGALIVAMLVCVAGLLCFAICVRPLVSQMGVVQKTEYKFVDRLDEQL